MNARYENLKKRRIQNTCGLNAIHWKMKNYEWKKKKKLPNIMYKWNEWKQTTRREKKTSKSASRSIAL